MKIKELIQHWKDLSKDNPHAVIYKAFIEQLEDTDEVKDMNARELLQKWKDAANDKDPKRAKICKDFADLLEKDINDGNEARIQACFAIQEEIDGLNYIRMGLGEKQGLPEYIEALNTSAKPLTEKEVMQQSKWLNRLVGKKIAPES